MAIMSGCNPPIMMSLQGEQCLACQLVDGKIRRGIYLCDPCYDRLLVQPYGGHHYDYIISSVSLRVPNPPTKYKELSVIYRFHEWNTLISAVQVIGQGIRSFPLLVLSGIKPMTISFLEDVGKNIDLWVLLS